MFAWVIPFSYLISVVFFILSMRGLASPKTAHRGNLLGILGMFIAVLITIYLPQMHDVETVMGVIIIGGVLGIWMAYKVKMASLPQMIAALNGFGGLAAVLVASAEVSGGQGSRLPVSLGLIIGAVAFSGSMVAFAKLQGFISSKMVSFRLQHVLNLALFLVVAGLCICFIQSGGNNVFYLLLGASLLLGILVVIPVGGADMPVVISVLNSYSGWATVGIGFSLQNILLIIVGALVGESGAILSYIMVKSMNRSLFNVMLGGGNHKNDHGNGGQAREVFAKSGSPADAAYLMENANKVIIVPGYGMAVARAQHVLKEMAYVLHDSYGVEVKFAIHPVAGRMPGHMNVLLAEAGVPYEDVFELGDINREFSTADVAYVIGANDVTNPVAKTDAASPIYGMPVLEVGKAKTVFFVKRSLNSGYSGVDNPLFYADNTVMLYGDGKIVTEEIVSKLEKDV